MKDLRAARPHFRLRQRHWEDEGTTRDHTTQKPKGAAGILAVLAALLVKGKALILFLIQALNLDSAIQLFKLGSMGGTLLTMALMVWAYAKTSSLAFAAGLVGLIFIHEMGHYLTAREAGVEVSAPVFIPFMGAFISMKGKPDNAEIEGRIAMAGPLAGTLGTGLAAAVWLLTGLDVLKGLVYVNLLITLFNLIPFGFLDGGRVASALSGRYWLVGLVLFGGLAAASRNPFLILVLLMGLKGALAKRKEPRAEDLYYEADSASLGILGIMYFGTLLVNGTALAVFLAVERGWHLL